MTTALTAGVRRYQPTPDECRRGGRAAAAKLTRAQRQAGGIQRSRQPSFIDLQRRRGRRGAQVVLERYGPKALAEILAQYYRANPSSLELFVACQLQTLEIAFERERVVEIIPATVYWRLDFVLPGQGPDGADLVIEPGAAHWHDPAHDAARYRTLAALGYRYVLTLTNSEIEHTPQCAAARIAAFLVDPARAGDPTPEVLTLTR
jgi:very-short-patch-repair endonuclease